MISKFKSLMRYGYALATLLACNSAFALENPLTKMGNSVHEMMFGVFGITLAAIIVGATFIMAMVGKITWDFFLFVFFCAAGFIGTPALVMVIRSAVS